MYTVHITGFSSLSERMALKILVGTSKGMVIVEKKKDTWTIVDTQFLGMPVSMIFTDKITGRWWVGLDHKHWGPKLHFTDDNGEKWYEVEVPAYSGYEYNQDESLQLKKIWVMENAGPDRPGYLWLGTEPGGLFYSENNGETFQLNESLWSHPGRMDESQWFGAGRDHPFIHSIVVDPRNEDHLFVAVSCAGVFASKDNGKSWSAKNNGLQATYLPNPNVNVGHDPHLVLACPANPEVMWQQNHCGIFRSIDQGERWEKVSGENGFPHYGFALAVDEVNPDEAWVIPAQSDEIRVAADLRMSVCYTRSGGKTWARQKQGLPSSPAFGIVLRHAFVKEGPLLVFGTNNGNLFLSEDRGNSWMRVSGDLPSIYYIKIG